MIRLDKTKIYIIAVVAILILAGIGYAFLSSDLSLNVVINVKKHEQQVDPEPEEQPICKRATTLHTEVCNGSNTSTTCYGSGYNQGDTITYGNLGTAGALSSGDAFDCDVNGDGIYNSTNERFYYVTSLDTDSSYGVLIYYNNIAQSAYDSEGKPRENGPMTLLSKIPTTSQWKNVSLKSTTRKIKDETGTEYIDFSYEGYAARLLTHQEAVSACGSGNYRASGYLDSCKYLLEHTYYANYYSAYNISWWLENTHSALTMFASIVQSGDRYLDITQSNQNVFGVRPAIEVPKSKIEY